MYQYFLEHIFKPVYEFFWQVSTDGNVSDINVVVRQHERQHVILFRFETCLWRQPYCLLDSGIVYHKTSLSQGLLIPLDCMILH